MANPLAKQMLNNLAQKAGNLRSEKTHTNSSINIAAHLSQHEEQTLIDLIHLRSKLYPDKPLAKAGERAYTETNSSGMISLAELAAKKR